MRSADRVLVCFLLTDVTSFKNLLISIKSGRSLDDRRACQFDARTEESSAVQYFQVSSILSLSLAFVQVRSILSL